MGLLQWLGLVSDVIGIVTLVFTIMVFWRARRRLANALETLRADESPAPVALAVGLGQDIRSVVQRYLNENELTMPLYNYHRAGMVPREQFHDVLRDILEIKQQIMHAGATEAHLFYMGPVTLSVGIGALMDNWVPVTVYKYVEGRYEAEFVLQKETVLGLLNQAIDTGVELVT